MSNGYDDTVFDLMSGGENVSLFDNEYPKVEDMNLKTSAIDISVGTGFLTKKDANELIDIPGKAPHSGYPSFSPTEVSSRPVASIHNLDKGDYREWSDYGNAYKYISQKSASVPTTTEAIDAGYKSYINSGVSNPESKVDYSQRVNEFNVNYEGITLSYGNRRIEGSERGRLKINLNLNNIYDNYVINASTGKRGKKMGGWDKYNKKYFEESGEEVFYIDILTSTGNKTDYQILGMINALPDADEEGRIKDDWGNYFYGDEIKMSDFPVHELQEMIVNSKSGPAHGGDVSGEWNPKEGEGVQILKNVGLDSKAMFKYVDEGLNSTAGSITVKDKNTDKTYLIPVESIQEFFNQVGGY